MKISKLITILSLSFSSMFLHASEISSEVPDTPPSPCYNDSCNEYMTQLYSDFLAFGTSPTLDPTVYSGTCRHLGMYSPDRDHHAVVLLDQTEPTTTPTFKNARFSAILAYFYETNEFADWNLATARKEMDSYWIDNGRMFYGDNTYRVVINDENSNPVLIYWMRQNSITQDLYFIFYSGHVMRSFCRLAKNAQQ